MSRVGLLWIAISIFIITNILEIKFYYLNESIKNVSISNQKKMVDAFNVMQLRLL